MTRTTRPLCAVLAVLAVCAGAAAAAQNGPWALRYNLKAGQVLRFRVTANVHGVLPLMGNPEPIDANAVIRMVYRASVKSRDAEGRAQVQFRVENVEVEIEKIPLPLPLEDVQKILDQDVMLTPAGEVTTAKAVAALPYDINIPGVDPQRLYTLLFPLVFPDGPLKVGDTWEFPLGLLGGGGTVVQAQATVQKPAAVPAARPGKAAPAPPVLVRNTFAMDVDQKLNADRKPLAADQEHAWSRTGRIEGDGTFRFNRAKGLVTAGTVRVNADLEEKPVAAPAAGQPAMIPTRVRATINVSLIEPAVPRKPAARPAARTGARGRR